MNDQLPVRPLQRDPGAETDEHGQHDDLRDGHDVARATGLRRAAVIDPGEQRDDRNRERLLERQHRGLESREPDQRQHQLEVGAESERIERAGDRVGEPAHPAAHEALRVLEPELYPQVAATGIVERGTELRVGRGREQRHDRIQQESQQQSRPGDAGRDAGQHEDAGADHRAHADHHDVEQPHLAAQAHLEGRVRGGRVGIAQAVSSVVARVTLRCSLRRSRGRTIPCQPLAAVP